MITTPDAALPPRTRPAPALLRCYARFLVALFHSDEPGQLERIDQVHTYLTHRLSAARD